MNHFNYFKNYKNNNTLVSLATPTTGFKRGNMFNNLYKPYRNYSVSDLTFKTDKERLMYEIQMHSFVVNDLVLYLDVNPTDQEALRSFKEYNQKYNLLVNEFERKYHPLCINSEQFNQNYFEWVNNWPKGVMM
ncbi:MAG: spore coat protein CotJB [Bacilli bacterium]|nr:spore coat protein CotJB [Bacilli bacterium]